MWDQPVADPKACLSGPTIPRSIDQLILALSNALSKPEIVSDLRGRTQTSISAFRYPWHDITGWYSVVGV